jgi:nitrate reductase NapAB chaperone NapD
MGSPKESLEQKNIFAEKYDEIRKLDGIYAMNLAFFL